eukprot:4909248-Prymnesium_polylepis.1
MASLFDQIKPLLSYRTNRYMKVDVWQVGLAHRLLQLGIIIFAVIEALNAGSWAYSETAAGTVNAYGATTAAYSSLVEQFDGSKTGPIIYCNNASYDYVYDRTFNYSSPQCIELDEFELVQKGASSVFFTTAYIEYQVLGWPCDQDDAAVHAKRAICFGGSGTADSAGVKHQPNGQCTCRAHRTYYPVGVEEMNVYFEHAYSTTDKVGSLHASSNEREPKGADGRLDTSIHFRNGSSVTFEGGALPAKS